MSRPEPRPELRAEREADRILAAAQRRDVRLGNRRIALLDWGGDGPLVLLHHANSFSKGCWGLVADVLAPRFRVVAMDARGHGDSDPAPASEGCSWASMGADLARVAESLSAELGGVRVALGIGHSFGGVCQLLAARESPECFERLLLVDPVIIPSEVMQSPERRAHVEELVERARQRRSEWASLAEARAWLGERELFSDWLPAAFQLYLRDGMREDANGGVALKCASAVEAEIFARGEEVDVPAACAGVAAPTLFLWSRRGRFPREVYEGLAATMPRAQVETADAGHLVPMERPELVVDAALRFLGETI